MRCCWVGGRGAGMMHGLGAREEEWDVLCACCSSRSLSASVSSIPLSSSTIAACAAVCASSTRNPSMPPSSHTTSRPSARLSPHAGASGRAGAAPAPAPGDEASSSAWVRSSSRSRSISAWRGMKGRHFCVQADSDTLFIIHHRSPGALCGNAGKARGCTPAPEPTANQSHKQQWVEMAVSAMEWRWRRYTAGSQPKRKLRAGGWNLRLQPRILFRQPPQLLRVATAAARIADELLEAGYLQYDSHTRKADAKGE